MAGIPRRVDYSTPSGNVRTREVGGRIYMPDALHDAALVAGEAMTEGIIREVRVQQNQRILPGRLPAIVRGGFLYGFRWRRFDRRDAGAVEYLLRFAGRGRDDASVNFQLAYARRFRDLFAKVFARTFRMRTR